MGILEGAVIAFVILAWIIRTIYQFIKWLIRQVKTVGVAPSPLQQAIAEAQRQQAALPVRPAAPRLPDTPVRRDIPTRPVTPARPPAPTTGRRTVGEGEPVAPLSLFSSTDDLVRAIILQEVLGPPLSRRMPSAAPVPSALRNKTGS